MGDCSECDIIIGSQIGLRQRLCTPVFVYCSNYLYVPTSFSYLYNIKLIYTNIKICISFPEMLSWLLQAFDDYANPKCRNDRILYFVKHKNSLQLTLVRLSLYIFLYHSFRIDFNVIIKDSIIVFLKRIFSIRITIQTKLL